MPNRLATRIIFIHLASIQLGTNVLGFFDAFFAVLYSQLAKSRGGKNPPNLPLANKRKDHSHTTPTLVSRTQYTCFRRVACTHADPSARLLPRESYKLVDPALKGFVHYRLLSHAEPMAYYIFLYFKEEKTT